MFNLARYERQIVENRTAREREHDARLACHEQVAEELLRTRRRRAIATLFGWLATFFTPTARTMREAVRASGTAVPKEKIAQ